MKKIVFLFLLIFSIHNYVFSQSDGLPRLYPLAMETWLYDDFYVKITYTEEPATGEGPEIGSLWQLGSNEPAEIISTGDLLVGADTLKAGAYSIFAIPGDSTWTFIFNKDVGMFGTYRYNENADVFRVEAGVESNQEYNRTLKIKFSRKGVPESTLSIFWKQQKISVPVQMLEPEHN